MWKVLRQKLIWPNSLSLVFYRILSRKRIFGNATWNNSENMFIPIALENLSIIYNHIWQQKVHLCLFPSNPCQKSEWTQVRGNNKEQRKGCGFSQSVSLGVHGVSSTKKTLSTTVWLFMSPEYCPHWTRPCQAEYWWKCTRCCLACSQWKGRGSISFISDWVASRSPHSRSSGLVLAVLVLY